MTIHLSKGVGARVVVASVVLGSMVVAFGSMVMLGSAVIGAVVDRVVEGMVDRRYSGTAATKM